MEGKLQIDIVLLQARLVDDETYLFSAEEGVKLVEELDLGVELLENLSSCILIKTSGSSGKAKWVVHAKSALLRHAALVNERLGVTKDDVFGLVLPTHHVGGLGVVARAHVSGASLVYLDQKWSASSGFDFITRNRVTLLSLVPTQLVDFVSAGLRCPGCIRLVVLGGGRLDASILSIALQLSWPVMESYGMTETGSQIATGEFTEKGFLRLIDGWEVCNNEGGILAVKGDCLFKGYLEYDNGRHEFVEPMEDGWYMTSDKVDLIEKNGEVGLKFLGRSDQQVKILGELVDVSSLEKELAALLGHEIFLITLPDSRRGMKLFPTVDKAALSDSFRDLGWSGLHELEEPVVVSHFPRNEMGKLQRAKLVETVESIVFSGE